jgi:hypothetical protein
MKLLTARLPDFGKGENTIGRPKNFGIYITTCSLLQEVAENYSEGPMGR